MVWRQKGAILLDNLVIPKASTIEDFIGKYEDEVLRAEFKEAINAYLSELTYSPVRSLADLITFNNKHKDEVKTYIKFFCIFIFLHV